MAPTYTEESVRDVAERAYRLGWDARERLAGGTWQRELEERAACVADDLFAEGHVRPAVPVRKAWVGWWVADEWCPTRAVRDHALRRLGGPDR